MEWIIAHWDALAAAAAFLFAGWKAWRAGSLNAFLVSKIEVIATKEEKQAIKADAIKTGAEALLSKVVKRVTA